MVCSPKYLTNGKSLKTCRNVKSYWAVFKPWENTRHMQNLHTPLALTCRILFLCVQCLETSHRHMLMLKVGQDFSCEKT